jgi:hypothetical protein
MGNQYRDHPEGWLAPEPRSSSYSEAKLAEFGEIARKRTESAGREGDPTIRVITLQPGDTEDEEDQVRVVVRPFTRVEFATYMGRDASATDNYNTALSLLIAVDEHTGKEAVQAFAKFVDGNDAVIDVLNEASAPMGILTRDEIRSARLNARTTQEEIASFGLPAEVIDLVKVHSEAGALRMVSQHGRSVVVRKPGRDEWLAAGKDKKRLFTAYSDLARTCIVWPAHIDERRSLFNQIPAFGFNLTPIFAEMREVASVASGKGSLRPFGTPRG